MAPLDSCHSRLLSRLDIQRYILNNIWQYRPSIMQIPNRVKLPDPQGLKDLTGSDESFY